MKSVWLMAALIAVAGCSQFGPKVGTDYTPTGTLQSVTLKDSSIKYDPAVLKAGTPRSKVAEAFGEPNATQTDSNGQVEDAYAFNPDGSKFVDPTIRPRNVAMAVFSAGVSVAVHQARIKLAERKLTVYKVTYGSDQTIQSVTMIPPSSGDQPVGAQAPGAGAPPVPAPAGE
jgi:hypothetical protein